MPNTDEDAEQGSTPAPLMRTLSGETTLENSKTAGKVLLKKTITNKICNCYMAQEPSNCIHTARNWKQPRCPSTSDWLSPCDAWSPWTTPQLYKGTDHGCVHHLGDL